MALNINILMAILLLMASSMTWANIVVNLTDGTSVELEAYQIYYRGSSVQPISEALTASVSMDLATVNQSIFLVYSGSPVEQLVVEAQNSGAVAVIVASSGTAIGGSLQYRWNDRDLASAVNITVIDVGYVEVGAGLGSELLLNLAMNNQIANITLVPEGIVQANDKLAQIINRHTENINPWVVVYSSGWIHAWNVFFILFSSANIVMAILQLVKFVKFYGGCTQSIAIYVLSIEIASNMIRVVCCFDFFGSNFLYPDWAVSLLAEVYFPFVIASFFLFTLYWHELMTSASVIVHPFIVKMKIPFFVISGFILAVQIAKTIVQTLTGLAETNIITSAFYLGAFVFIVVLYAVTGIKLLLRLRQSKNLGRTVNLTKSTIKVLISGGFILVFVALALIFVTGIPYTPILFPVMWFIVFLVVSAASLMNILAFELPTKWSSKNQSTGVSIKTTSITMEPDHANEP